MNDWLMNHPSIFWMGFGIKWVNQPSQGGLQKWLQCLDMVSVQNLLPFMLVNRESHNGLWPSPIFVAYLVQSRHKHQPTLVDQCSCSQRAGFPYWSRKAIPIQPASKTSLLKMFFAPQLLVKVRFLGGWIIMVPIYQLLYPYVWLKTPSRIKLRS